MGQIKPKIKKSLTVNLGLKILAVIVATLLWLTVVNINDPEKTVTIYNIPITITNQKALASANMVYTVDSKPYVNVVVSGKRSVINGLDQDDFVATASLKELSKVNAIPVEVLVKKGHSGVSIVKQSVQSININVENVEKKEFQIELGYKGTIATGFMPKDYILDKNMVVVSAPTSEMNSISKVIAEYNIEGVSADETKQCRLYAVDKQGNVLTSKRIRFSFNKVKATVEVAREKKAKIQVYPIGNPKEGYEVTGIEMSMKNVTLTGDEENVEHISTIEIDDIFNIANKSTSVTHNIDLRDYVPEGVEIVGDYQVKITVVIKKTKVTKVSISKDIINIEKLPSDAKATILTKKITIILKGEDSESDSISGQDLNPSINLEGLEAGIHTVPLIVSIPEGVEVEEEVKIKVKIE